MIARFSLQDGNGDAYLVIGQRMTDAGPGRGG